MDVGGNRRAEMLELTHRILGGMLARRGTPGLLAIAEHRARFELVLSARPTAGANMASLHMVLFSVVAGMVGPRAIGTLRIAASSMMHRVDASTHLRDMIGRVATTFRWLGSGPRPFRFWVAAALSLAEGNEARTRMLRTTPPWAWAACIAALDFSCDSTELQMAVRLYGVPGTRARGEDGADADPDTAGGVAHYARCTR
jgi:hypothetical protein